jgi:hypothetical protein
MAKAIHVGIIESRNGSIRLRYCRPHLGQTIGLNGPDPRSDFGTGAWHQGQVGIWDSFTKSLTGPPVCVRFTNQRYGSQSAKEQNLPTDTS